MTNISKNDVVDKLRESIQDLLLLNQSKNIETEHDGIYMFFSFDIVNSTSFKEKFQDRWRSTISRFYDISEKTMNAVIGDKVCSVETWKYVGDEILFYKKLSSRKELLDNVRKVYYVQQVIYKKLCETDKIVKSNIHIKTTIWTGKCSEKADESKNQIYVSYEKREYNEKYGTRAAHIDFLGPDIDAGFRISKYVEKAKVVVSAKLACLLHKVMVNDDNNELFTSEERMIIKSCFKIVSYEQLKGIWSNRHYPIIWYDHNWDRPTEMFEYDDYFTSKIAKNIFTCNSEFEKSIYNLEILPKIYNDLNKENDIDDILEYLKKLENGEIEREIINNVRKNYINSEVHCVAICFYNNEEVFVAKRSDDRDRLKGAWELGCGKINNDEKWTECLIKEYKDNFNLDLKFDEDITPIAIYDLNKDGITIPGIIFMANVEKKEERCNTNKYSEVTWVKTTDIDEFFSEKETVDDLVYNIRKAIKIRQAEK